MPLLDFNQDSSEILWMGEAIANNVVKEGELCQVARITRTTDQRGFLIETDYKGNTIFDYAWKKGRTGSTLAVLFDDPAMGDDNLISCKAQSKVKNAILVSSEQKGASWHLLTQEGKEVLVCIPKTRTTTSTESKDTEK